MEKHIIRAIEFSNRRVGSTFLQQAINSHTDIIGIDEVFVNEIKPQFRKSGFVPYINSDIDNPCEYIEEVINKTYPDSNTIFKLMYHQILYHESLRACVIDIPMIHVIRKNLVKQVISELKMGLPKDHKIIINPSDFYEKVKVADNLNKVNTQHHTKQIKLKLFYEDLFGDIVDERTYMSNNSNIAVCRFFNVKQVRLFAMTKKRLSDKVEDHLSNIKEIKNAFRGTDYEWMLY